VRWGGEERRLGIFSIQLWGYFYTLGSVLGGWRWGFFLTKK